MKIDCEVCKFENSDKCNSCYPSSYWGKCYFEKDPNKESKFVNLTSKDKLYDFVDIHSTGKPIHFTSKGQWKRHLKKLGRTDDFDQGKKLRMEDLKKDSSTVYDKQKRHQEIKKMCGELYREKVCR